MALTPGTREPEGKDPQTRCREPVEPAAAVARASEGTCAITNHHVRDVLDSLGGLTVLFPIFAQFSLPDEKGSYAAAPELAVEVIELIGAMLRCVFG